VFYFRPFKQEPLAKTGDAEKRLLLVEWGVRIGNEAAHGIVADLNPTGVTSDNPSSNGPPGE